MDTRCPARNWRARSRNSAAVDPSDLVTDEPSDENDCTRLVWFEQHATMLDAIAREKRIKEWKRAWKLELIETNNPRWRDLYDDLLG